MTRANTTVMLTLRLLIAVGCLVPFAGPRAIASVFGLAPPAAVLGGGQLPSAPGNEEEEKEKEREETVKEATAPRHDRRIARTELSVRMLPVARSGKPLAANPIPCPAPLDPFRNGLGSPYRC